MPTSPTGRLVSGGSNLQTIPVRTPEGTAIRNAFIGDTPMTKRIRQSHPPEIAHKLARGHIGEVLANNMNVEAMCDVGTWEARMKAIAILNRNKALLVEISHLIDDMKGPA